MKTRREFLGSLVAALCAGKIVGESIVANDPSLSISNRPNSNSVFTEEGLRKALREFEGDTILYPDKIIAPVNYKTIPHRINYQIAREQLRDDILSNWGVLLNAKR